MRASSNVILVLVAQTGGAAGGKLAFGFEPEHSDRLNQTFASCPQARPKSAT